MANRHGEQINCYQINLKHSRVATNNLMQIIAQENTDMVMIQELYLYQNSPKIITKATERTAKERENVEPQS
jgi:hypothetical protein